MSFLIYPNKLRRLSGAIMRALSGGGVGAETRHALSAEFSSRRSSALVAGFKSSDAINKHYFALVLEFLLESILHDHCIRHFFGLDVCSASRKHSCRPILMCCNHELSGINCKANAQAGDHCQVKLEKTAGLIPFFQETPIGSRAPHASFRSGECALHVKHVTLDALCSS